MLVVGDGAPPEIIEGGRVRTTEGGALITCGYDDRIAVSAGAFVAR